MRKGRFGLIRKLKRKVMTCEQCNKPKFDATREVCPYSYEIDDVVDWINICNDCYQYRCDEI